jgi:hypothetical protein
MKRISKSLLISTIFLFLISIMVSCVGSSQTTISTLSSTTTQTLPAVTQSVISTTTKSPTLEPTSSMPVSTITPSFTTTPTYTTTTTTLIPTTTTPTNTSGIIDGDWISNENSGVGGPGSGPILKFTVKNGKISSLLYQYFLFQMSGLCGLLLVH